MKPRTSLGAGPVIAVLAAAVLMAGCAVDGDAKEVAVEHPANQFLVAEVEARDHCAWFGKRARHLKTSPKKGFGLFVLTSRVSLFACEAP